MRRVLVTGASSGIGASLLDLLTPSAGFHCVTLGRRRTSAAEHIVCDLVERGSIDRVCAQLQDMAFTDFVHCAGAGYFEPVSTSNVDDWVRCVELNLVATYRLVRAVLPRMLAQKAGRLILVSSDADAQGFAGASAYCAAKAGMRGLCAALRKELVGTGVSLNLVSPGRVDTPFNSRAVGDRPFALSAGDVASAIHFIMLSAARCDWESICIRSNLE